MFTWILIILAIAFIFGVIKVEQVKAFAKKHEPKARELLDKTTTFVKEKSAEISKNIEAQKNNSKAQTNEEDKKEAEEETKNTDAE